MASTDSVRRKKISEQNPLVISSASWRPNNGPETFAIRVAYIEGTVSRFFNCDEALDKRNPFSRALDGPGPGGVRPRRHAIQRASGLGEMFELSGCCGPQAGH